MGMVTEGEEASLKELLSTRKRIIDEINISITREEKNSLAELVNLPTGNSTPSWYQMEVDKLEKS